MANEKSNSIVIWGKLQYFGNQLWEKIKGAFAPLVHTHTIADTTDLQTALDTKADTTTVQQALDTKADTVHTNMIQTTYRELKTLRDGGNLKAGNWYRITDFVTTVANDDEARSAYNAFDVLVLATSNNTLSEEARAIKREGDTYFAQSNLNAWKIWYCLDNDTLRFAWANTTNGKGVIYRMVDEYQNDCPYDFKNVQFIRYVDNNSIDCMSPYVSLQDKGEGSKWSYTFTYLDDEENVVDATLLIKDMRLGNNLEEYKQYNMSHNTILEYSSCQVINDKIYVTQYLNNIVMTFCKNDDMISIKIYNNHFGSNCYNNTLVGKTHSNTFGEGCSSNTFGEGITNVTFSSFTKNQQRT